jgi:hypothetical protein
MKIKIQRTRFWRGCGPSKPLIVWLDGSRRHRVIPVHRRDSLVREIQPETKQDFSPCNGLIPPNFAHLANAPKESQDEFQTSA